MHSLQYSLQAARLYYNFFCPLFEFSIVERLVIFYYKYNKYCNCINVYISKKSYIIFYSVLYHRFYVLYTLCALVSIFRKRISLLRIIYYIIEMHHIFNMIDDKFYLFPQHIFLRDFTCSTR